ncbi:prolipoprotein diacylglyceryl transferase [Aeromicrobium sp. CF4.19]|uniref:prolipoprotein diacylglyceryl transferase n=1 Tax=Aeromicrobium sp. CF4.19 TaxID=3373082 RepID=UPI003EE7ADB3
MSTTALVASIPSPDTGVLYLGPLPLRAYAFGIIIGALLAIWMTERRYVARGGRAGAVGDIAIWAIPSGIIGARIYHVLTSPELYFGEGRNPVEALYIWNGGLGIWGAVAGGAVGAWIACRRYGVRPSELADALAPGLLVAQAVGRLGNYFNQELFGRPTDLPWGLEIDVANRPNGFEQFATFHPTFLYELLWNLAAALLIVLIDRRVRLTHGRAWWLYVMLYTAGRVWTEALRIDTANMIGPFRLNVWTSILVFALGAVMFWWCTRRSRREPDVAVGTDDAGGGSTRE